jgi:hypothetical protein
MLLVVEKVLHDSCWHVWQKNWYDVAYINHKQIHLKFNYVKSSYDIFLNLFLHNFKHAPKSPLITHVTFTNANMPPKHCATLVHMLTTNETSHLNQKKMNDVLGPKVMYSFFVNEFYSLGHAASNMYSLSSIIV